MHPPAYQKPQNRVYWSHSDLVLRKLLSIRYVCKIRGIISFVGMTWPRMRALHQTFKKELWSCIQTISNPANWLACVMGLSCAHVCVILAVISGTTSTNISGWKKIQICGSRTFARSEKCGHISIGKLLRCGTRAPIGVGISITHHN